MRRQHPTMHVSTGATSTWFLLTLATGCLALPYKSSSFSTSFSNFTSQKPNPNFASANYATSNFATNNYTSPNYMTSNWSQTWSQGFHYQYQNEGAGNGAPAKRPWRPPFPQQPMPPGNPGGFASNGNSFPQQTMMPSAGGFSSGSGVSRPFYRPPTQQSSAGSPGPPNFGSNNQSPPYSPPPPFAGNSNNNAPAFPSGNFNNNGPPVSSGSFNNNGPPVTANGQSVSSGSISNNGAEVSSGPFNFNPPPASSENSNSNAPQRPSVGSSFNVQPVPPEDSNSISPVPPEASSSNSSSPWLVEALEPNRFGASTSSGDQPPKRNSVDGAGCRDEGGKQYSVGDKWTPPGSCSRLTCLRDGKTSSLGCPSTEAVENCSVSPEDPRQPWPLCCPQIQCTQ